MLPLPISTVESGVITKNLEMFINQTLNVAATEAGVAGRGSVAGLQRWMNGSELPCPPSQRRGFRGVESGLFLGRFGSVLGGSLPPPVRYCCLPLPTPATVPAHYPPALSFLLPIPLYLSCWLFRRLCTFFGHTGSETLLVFFVFPPPCPSHSSPPPISPAHPRATC